MFGDQPTMKCPLCGSQFSRIYKCGMCGEIRCGQETCSGSKDSGVRGFAAAGALCKHCGEGRYNPVSFYSNEVARLMSKRKSEESDF